MATDLDDLVEQLLFDVAFAGNRGLGAEEVDSIVENHHDHMQPSASAPADFDGDNSLSTNTQSPTNGSDLASLIASVWQRLEEHLDVIVETSGDAGPPQLDSDDAPEPVDSSDASKPVSDWVYASEARIWQAIVGHEVDHKLLPPKMFDILEVVAAAGPDGILQPEARRLTGQDKQSIPLRTDKLADRKYIIKEKITVPKMITSRLRHWRFATEGNSPGSDSSRTDQPSDREYIDHDKYFEGITRLLQGNGGIAVMKDIQLETDCTSKLKRKSLGRAIGRLEKCGMLRRIKAKVQGEDNIKGGDRFSRCVQLLRQPTDSDREAMVGGPDRPRVTSMTSNEHVNIDPSLEAGNEQLDVHDVGANEEPKALSTGETSMLASDPIDSVATVRSSTSRQPAGDQTIPGARTLHDASLPFNGTPVQSSTSQAGKKRQNSSTTSREAGNVQQPISASLDDDNPEIHSGPGVFFTHKSGKKKVGRPKKSLVAVFKSDKLRDHSWFGGATSVLQPSSSSAADAGQPRLDAEVSSVSPGDPATLGPSALSTAASLPTTSTPVALRTPIDEFTPLDRQQASAITAPKTLSRSSLGQLRRRERKRAQRAAAAADQTDDLIPVDQLDGAVDAAQVDPPAERLQTSPEGATETPTKRELGQRRRHERNRAEKAAAGERTGLMQPMTQLGGVLDAAQNDSPTYQPQPSAETPARTISNRSLGQIRRKERERAEKAATNRQTGDVAPIDQLDGSLNIAQSDSPIERQQQFTGEALETPSSHTLGQRRRRERERIEKMAAAQRTSEPTSSVRPDHVVGAGGSQSLGTKSSLVAKLPLARDLLQRVDGRSNTDIETSPQSGSARRVAASNTEPVGAGAGAEEQDVQMDDVTSSASDELPQLRFIAFEDDAASAKPKTPYQKRTTTNLGAVHIERCNVLMGIVRAANGVYPGSREIWYPFSTKWAQTHTVTAEPRTVAKLVETLRRDRKLSKYEFRSPNGRGGLHVFNILMEPTINPSSEQVTSVQQKMIDAFPGAYVPDEIEVTDKVRLSSRYQPTVPQQKRARDHDNEEANSDTHKRRKLSGLQADDDEYVDDGDDVDEDEDVMRLSGDYEQPDNYPEVSGILVKRTAAGLEHSNVQARRNGFADAKARAQANTQLGRPGYLQLRKDAIGGGHLVDVDEVRARSREGAVEEASGLQGSANQTALPAVSSMVEAETGSADSRADVVPPTPVSLRERPSEAPKRVGRPKGRPKGSKNITKHSRGDDVAALLSLLFYPQQIAHAQSGTIGTYSELLLPPKVVELGAGQSTSSKKRSADQMDHETNPVTSLLMGSGQSISESSWTFGTNGTAETAPQLQDAAGRGKRVKRSTEKGITFTDRAVPATSTTPSTKTTPSSRKKTSATSTRPTKKAAPNNLHLLDDPDDLVSTDYVNRHPGETWYHRGKGRWLRGLPPPGSSYKTAVKGPEAAAYLARIGTSEGKTKQHGAFVDGVQLQRNGEPWQTQPKTVNGVRVNPVDETSKLPAEATLSQPSTHSGAVPSVQYEVPPPTPAPGYQDPSTAGPAMPYAPQQPPPSYPSVRTINRQAQVARSALPAAVKPKRPYTYRTRKRKQLSTVGPDGVPIELDRASDDDYTQTRSPKRQKKTAQAQLSPAKARYSIDRNRLLTAVALAKNLSPVAKSKEIRWDLVCLALDMDDKGAAAQQQYKSILHWAPHAKFATAVQEELQEPFLAALEHGDLPHVDHVALERSDWPGLLEWAEKNVVPLVTDETLKHAKKAIDMFQPLPTTKTKSRMKNSKSSRPIVDAIPVFPATYNPEPDDKSSNLDLNEDMIMVKSWIRANSTTKNEMYNQAKATEKLTALGPPILQAVKDMQESNTIRQLKSGRQRPGRNFEITHHAWSQFAKWPGDVDGAVYLRDLGETRGRIVQHFRENDTLEMASSISEQETLVLNSMLAQVVLKMEVRLPPRNDDLDAPFPKLNAWSYGGPRHDTRKIDRTIFNLPVVYTKTAAFSAEHGLRTGVPIPTLPQPLPNEALPRVPFWIDIHGNLIPDIWEMVLSSILYMLVRRPGTTAKGIEKAHGNKLWAWEIDIALGWMEKVGVAERFGGGKEVDGVWKGGWTVGEEWFCVLAGEVAVWR